MGVIIGLVVFVSLAVWLGPLWVIAIAVVCLVCSGD